MKPERRFVMNKIKNYFDGEKDERIRQGAYKAEAYAF